MCSVELGRDFSVFGGLRSVGSTIAKVLKTSAFLSDIMTLFLMCIIISKEHE